MAYLKNYEWDVFVSYAQRDMEKNAPDKNGYTWSRQVKEQLEAILKANFGRKENPPKFFIDESALIPGARLTEQIAAAVSKSAILLVIVTKDYLDSEWCEQELAEFIRAHPDSERDGGSGIYVVEAQETSRDDKWPSGLKDGNKKSRLGCTLYKKVGSGDFPLGFAGSDAGEFQQQLSKIGADLTGMLDAIKTLEEQQVPNHPGGHDDKRTIYLASWVPNLNKDRKECLTYLAEKGYTVVPTTARLPPESDIILEADRYLDKSTAFVQILGAEGGESNQAILQYNRAKDRKLPMFHWKEKDLIVNENYADLYPEYTDFAKETFPQANTDSLREFVSIVHDRIEELNTGRHDINIDDNHDLSLDEMPVVYIFSPDQKGYEFVRSELKPGLSMVIANHGWMKLMPNETVTPSELSKFEQENLKDADALIIVRYPHQNDSILRIAKRLSRDFKILNEAANPPKSLYIGVLEGPPGGKHEQIHPSVPVFDCADRKIHDDLTNWLVGLKKKISGPYQCE
jgi:hypothetical protein